MPSPFPGMDPFLEHPAIFSDLHDSLITYLREALQAKLPVPYYAGIGSRIWVETTRRSIGPDVRVSRPESDEEVRQVGGEFVGDEGSAVVATAVRTRPVVVTVPHDEMRETFVEIFSRRDGERLVTTIEVLSPANKSPGEHGRDLYLRKQREILDGKVHLVEIDLLRGGEHTTAVPHDRAVEKAGPFSYHVCVHRFDNLEDYFVYPVRLADPLPEIAVPLLPGDPDIPLDLREIFNRCYDAGGYGRRIRYDRDEPVPPLTAKQTAWVRQLRAPK